MEKNWNKELTKELKLRLRDYFNSAQLNSYVFMLENKSNRYKCVMGITGVKTKGEISTI